MTTINELVETILNGDIAFFVGAGISFHSGLPLASELKKRILCQLPVNKKEASQIQSATLPFEAFFETLSRGGSIDSLLKLFRKGMPNPNHFLIAKLTKYGYIRKICTTNFDLLIERAFESEGLSKNNEFKVLSLENEFENNDSRLGRGITLYKVHGSADNLSSVVVTLRRIAARSYSAARQHVINDLFSEGVHSHVLVLGYSCSDVFDLIPQIEAIIGEKKKVYFVEHCKGESKLQLYPLGRPFAAYPGATLRIDTDYFIRELWERTLSDSLPNISVPVFSWPDFISTWKQELRLANAFFIAGELLRQIGMYFEAISQLREAINTTKHNGDVANVCRSYGSLGTCLRALGRYEEALDAYQSGYKLSEKTNSDRNQSRFLGDIGSVYRNKGEYSTALMYQKQSLRAALWTGDELVAQVHANLGNTFHMLGKYRAAANHHQQAAQAAETAGDKRLEALSVGNLGSALLIMGDTLKAGSYFKRAIELAELISDRRTLLTNLSNIATLRELQGDIKQSIDTYEQALEIALETSQRELEASVRSNLAACYGLLKEYNRSIEQAKLSLEVARKIGDIRTEVRALGNLGIGLFHMANKEEAINALENALILARKIGDKRGEALQLKNLSELHYFSGELTLAEQYSKQCLELSILIGEKRIEARALYWLSACRPSEGREFLEIAATIFKEIGAERHPEAIETHKQLQDKQSVNMNMKSKTV
ncbi:MAG: hypothetical protein IEMM0007_1296 [bacterium]|nr:MAG: hypothetical protein IEMM0007_1296 [bacterium]